MQFWLPIEIKAYNKILEIENFTYAKGNDTIQIGTDVS